MSNLLYSASSAVGPWYAKVHEDGSFSNLARVTAIQGTGTQVRPHEGNCLKIADVSTIVCKVYNLGTDREATTGTEVTPAPSLTPADNLYDTIQTNGWPTEDDPHGYNFRHDVGPAYVPDPGTWYLFEYKITLTGGGVIWHKVRVETDGVIQS